jgi:hypothetical protein
MKRISQLAVATCIMLSAATGLAQMGTNRTPVLGGKASLILPKGFEPMDEETIAVKFPRGNPPKEVFSNERGKTSIAITVSEGARLPPDKLPEFRKYIESVMERMIPGLKWISREYTEIDGRKWARLELMSTAIDTDIHNIILITSFEGMPLMFNFNSIKEEFAALGAELDRSTKSIKIEKDDLRTTPRTVP